MIYGYDGLGHTVRITHTIGWLHAVLFTEENKGNEKTRVGKTGLKPLPLTLSAYKMSSGALTGQTKGPSSQEEQHKPGKSM